MPTVPPLSKPPKAKNLVVTDKVLNSRKAWLAKIGYPVSRWISFCEVMLGHGLTVTLYEAKQTRSKYITVAREGQKPYKVRFSDHAPIAQRETRGDCDFFVGRTNFTVTTTEQAILATLKNFNITPKPFTV